MAKMGGPFYIKPYEIHDELEAMGRGFNVFYDNIVRHAIIKDHWEDEDTIWVRGTFRATKEDMRRWMPPMCRRTFQRRWAKMTETGIIKDNEDGSFDIPRYKKRDSEGIRVSEVKMIAHNLDVVVAKVDRIEKKIGEKDEMAESHQVSSPVKKSQKPVKKSQKPVIGDRGATSITDARTDRIIDQNKISLSAINKIISAFHRGIGQPRISRKTREYSQKIFQELLKQDFSPDEIAYAVDWILENATEKIRTFGIVESIIGQALEAREKETKARENRQAIEQTKLAEKAKRAQEIKESEELNAEKERLSVKERKALEKEAEQELRATKGIQPGMITHVLISIKETEILKRKKVRPDPDAAAD